ncbi:SGNH hydrolase-type esterase domain-containing protein [Xylariomycetidae sp. FL2044]|nr:SGNH hydrolase-type esterase domain-containing protein [Xylariomycetidae sp. FL2044]
MEQISSHPVVSMVFARKRLILFVCIPLLLIGLLFSGAAHVDSEWSQKLNDIGAGIRNGVKPTGDSDQGGVSYVKGGGKPYARPGYDAPLAGGIPLRIMCLGASTTRGDSPEEGIDNNGFRRPVRERLTAAGNKVNFVGTQRLGNMTDNDIEAYPGVNTETIYGNARNAVPPTQPNLFLVNAGSNDCFQHLDINNFYKRYDALITFLLEASPRSTVIICTILPTWDTRFNGREEVWLVNPQIRRLAQIYKEEGKPVVLAELQGPDGIQDENLASDGMHPGTAGYEMMGTKMFEAIVEADAKGFLQAPEPIEGIPDDGDEEERKDENYMKWAEQQQTIEGAREAADEAAISTMKAALAIQRAEHKRKRSSDSTVEVQNIRRRSRALVV